MFSFESPKSYQYTFDNQIKDGQAEYGVGLGIPVTGFPVTVFKDIPFYNPKLTITAVQSYETAESYLDILIKSIQNSGITPEGNKLSIIKHSSIYVAGISAEEILLSISSVLRVPLDPISPSLARRVFLSYNSKIWIIDLESSENITDQAQSDFDHIIKSFKFLN